MDRSKGNLRGVALLPLAALALTIMAGCMKQTQHAPDVWAVVNGKEIRRDEVDKYYRTRVNPEGQEPSQEEALSLKLNVLDQLIYNEILLERAKKMGLEASDGEVEDKFTERKSPYTEDEFQRQLKEQGISVDDWKQDMRRQLSIQKLLNKEVLGKIAITDQEVTGADCSYAAEGSANPQPQKRRCHQRVRSLAQNENAHRSLKQRRGLRSVGHGLL